MKKIRLTNVYEFQGEEIFVFKNDFEIYYYIGGYYGINLKGDFGGSCVFGGDSGWDDSYNNKIFKEVFKNWNGMLVWCGDKYRIEI